MEQNQLAKEVGQFFEQFVMQEIDKFETHKEKLMANKAKWAHLLLKKKEIQPIILKALVQLHPHLVKEYNKAKDLGGIYRFTNTVSKVDLNQKEPPKVSKNLEQMQNKLDTMKTSLREFYNENYQEFDVYQYDLDLQTQQEQMKSHEMLVELLFELSTREVPQLIESVEISVIFMQHKGWNKHIDFEAEFLEEMRKYEQKFNTIDAEYFEKIEWVKQKSGLKIQQLEQLYSSTKNTLQKQLEQASMSQCDIESKMYQQFLEEQIQMKDEQSLTIKTLPAAIQHIEKQKKVNRLLERKCAQLEKECQFLNKKLDNQSSQLKNLTIENKNLDKDIVHLAFSFQKILVMNKPIQKDIDKLLELIKDRKFKQIQDYMVYEVQESQALPQIEDRMTSIRTGLFELSSKVADKAIYAGLIKIIGDCKIQDLVEQPQEPVKIEVIKKKKEKKVQKEFKDIQTQTEKLRRQTKASKTNKFQRAATRIQQLQSFQDYQQLTSFSDNQQQKSELFIVQLTNINIQQTQKTEPIQTPEPSLITERNNEQNQKIIVSQPIKQVNYEQKEQSQVRKSIIKKTDKTTQIANDIQQQYQKHPKPQKPKIQLKYKTPNSKTKDKPVYELQEDQSQEKLRKKVETSVPLPVVNIKMGEIIQKKARKVVSKQPIEVIQKIMKSTQTQTEKRQKKELPISASPIIKNLVMRQIDRKASQINFDQYESNRPKTQQANTSQLDNWMNDVALDIQIAYQELQAQFMVMARKSGYKKIDQEHKQLLWDKILDQNVKIGATDEISSYLRGYYKTVQYETQKIQIIQLLINDQKVDLIQKIQRFPVRLEYHLIENPSEDFKFDQRWKKIVRQLLERKARVIGSHLKLDNNLSEIWYILAKNIKYVKYRLRHVSRRRLVKTQGRGRRTVVSKFQSPVQQQRRHGRYNSQIQNFEQNYKPWSLAKTQKFPKRTGSVESYRIS